MFLARSRNLLLLNTVKNVLPWKLLLFKFAYLDCIAVSKFSDNNVVDSIEAISDKYVENPLIAVILNVNIVRSMALTTATLPPSNVLSSPRRDLLNRQLTNTDLNCIFVLGN